MQHRMVWKVGSAARTRRALGPDRLALAVLPTQKRSLVNGARQALWHSHISTMEKILPLPLREGVGGRGEPARTLQKTPPPSPSRKGRGRIFSVRRPISR